MTNNRVFITIVIPTHNRKDILEKCLEALSNQSYPQDRYEILVIDDGSTDGTKALLEKLSKEIGNLRYMSQEQGGPAKARNLGINKAKGPIILITGDDCIADNKLLEEHSKIHQRESNVAVLGRIEWSPDIEITPFMEYVGKTHQFNFPSIEQERRNVSFCYFYTSNISVAKNLLIKVGLFDEDFTDAVYEDVELGYRLWKAGLRIIYNDRALTYHHHPVTLRGYIQRQIRAGKAAVIFHQKHSEVSDELRMEDAVCPEIIENFYDSVLRYYYALGIQVGIKELNGEKIDQDKFIVPLEDLMERWRSKISDRLIRELKNEKQHVKNVQDTLNSEIEKKEALLRKMNEIITNLKLRNDWLENELKSYRDFAANVKASFPYRCYKSLKTLIRRG